MDDVPKGTEEPKQNIPQELSFAEIYADSISIEIVIAIVVVIVTLVLYAVWRGTRNKRRGILLVGLCDSGKTLIFARLLHEKFYASYTSIKDNIGTYVRNNKQLTLLDIPGNDRLRTKYFDLHKNQARGIVFVIDSSGIQKEIRDVAEYLYTILSDATVSSISPAILIACNKQDQTMAKGSKVIQALIEKEMNVVRVTMSSRLESIDDSGRPAAPFLGIKGKDFEFAHLAPVRVEFVEVSAVKTGEDKPSDLEPLKKWLAKQL